MPSTTLNSNCQTATIASADTKALQSGCQSSNATDPPLYPPALKKEVLDGMEADQEHERFPKHEPSSNFHSDQQDSSPESEREEAEVHEPPKSEGHDRHWNPGFDEQSSIDAWGAGLLEAAIRCNSLATETQPSGDQSRSPISDWAANPEKATLRRCMGISADLDPKLQEELSREFRKEVRKLANIDFTKTWTQLSREGKTEGMISRVLDGMKEYSWGRELTVRTIKSIISEGRSNENRKRNRQLAAAATEARRRTPPVDSHRSPDLLQPPSRAARTRPLPQALPDDEAAQRLAKRAKRQRRGSAASAADDDCEEPERDHSLRPLSRGARSRPLPQALPDDEVEQRLAKRAKSQHRGSTAPAAGDDCEEPEQDDQKDAASDLLDQGTVSSFATAPTRRSRRSAKTVCYDKP